MTDATVYLKCERKVRVQSADVFLKDIGSLRCADKIIDAKLKALKVYHFRKEEPKRCVICVLDIVKIMEETCPGVTVQVLGETDTLVEWAQVDKKAAKLVWWKVLAVSLISFFGTAFTIMAYHNDAGINDIFDEMYRLLMNREPGNVNVLQISYSIGLAIGIIVFFNHIGGRRLGKDPTPIEVAMRKYEEDVDNALIAQAEREGIEIQGDSND